MKILLTLIILALATSACTNKQVLKNKNLIVSDIEQKTDSIFEQVLDFPTIKDTTQFINDLRQAFFLEVHTSPVQQTEQEITAYKKVKIYGSDKEYFLIEYDWKAGSMAEYPWKYQLLLTTDGKLVKMMSAQRFDFVTIFPNQNPLLLTVVVTAKGNGGHELYKISADTLENIYEGYFDYDIRTYDAHEDGKIYKPNELTLKIKDYNNDGYNDISFNGEIVYIKGQTKDGGWVDDDYSVDNPFKKIPVEFIFLYDKHTGHFKAKENYTEKYELDN